MQSFWERRSRVAVSFLHDSYQQAHIVSDAVAPVRIDAFDEVRDNSFCAGLPYLLLQKLCNSLSGQQSKSAWTSLCQAVREEGQHIARFQAD